MPTLFLDDGSRQLDDLFVRGIMSFQLVVQERVIGDICDHCSRARLSGDV